MRRPGLYLASLLLSLWLGVEARAQLDAEAAMREGNSLFRSGLYRGALLRYQEAQTRGLDSALLDYNIGIASYKVGDYAAAAESLTAARRDPNLAALAAYNLGLTEKAAGRPDEAKRWFTAAADAAADRRLRRLARNAAEAPEGLFETVPARSARTAARVEPRVPLLIVQVDAAYGTDDNPNRTPAEPYVDLAQAGQPLVVPEAFPSVYKPIRIAADYLIPNESGDTNFRFGYRLDGHYFEDEMANNESHQRLAIGAESVFGQTAKRKRTLQSEFFVVRHYQRDFDPDTGIDREVLGEDISRRFTYTGAGVRGDFDHFIGKWRWGLDMRFERRQHEEVTVVPDYDNELYVVAASVDYSLNPATTISLGLQSYRRLYDERLSYDLTGAMLATNPTVEYSYQGTELGFMRRFKEKFELELGIGLLDRVDGYLGYYDFSQQRLGLHGRFRPGPRFMLSAGAVSRVYDYPNAFAFNDPAAGPRELEDLSAELYAEYRFDGGFTIFADLGNEDVTSTDPRVAYARAQTVIGMTWRR